MFNVLSGLEGYYYLILPVLLINLGFALNLFLRGQKHSHYSLTAIILIIFVILIFITDLIETGTKILGRPEFSIMYVYAATVLSGSGFFVGYILGGKA